MASTFNIITPEEHVRKETGKLLADRYSFLEEQRRRLAALPDDISLSHDENNPTISNSSSNNVLNGK